MPYNIYLTSPQLALQANQRKQYQRQIKIVNQIRNRPFPKKYGRYYGLTAYQYYLTPNQLATPGY